MDVRQSVLGEIAIRSGHQLASIDLGVLIRRLVLFDRVVVKSFRLRELPLLVRTFGKHGIQELLNSGALKFCCEFTCVITDIHRGSVRSVPEEHFTFGIADAADRDRDLRRELQGLQSVSGLKNDERDAIEQAVWNSLVRPPATFGANLLEQIDADLRANSPALKAGILDQLQKEITDFDRAGGELQVSVEEPQHRVFRIKNTIARDFGLAPEKVHPLLQRSITAVVNLDHRLAEMQAYSAITGFLEREAPFLFGKLAGIIAPLNPKIADVQFNRIIELADVPDFKPGQRVDVEKLMKIRESAECREFRAWLSSVENISDAEICGLVGE